MAMQPYPMTVETLTTEDGDLSKALGDDVEIELPKSKVVHEVRIRVTKGSLDTGSYDNPTECFDVLENVNLQVANNDLFDVDGEAVKVLNQRLEGSTTQDTTSPSGAGREAEYSLYLASEVPVSKVSQALLKLNTRAISDISGGSQIADSPTEDLEISVIAMVSESGSFKDYNKVSRKPDNVQAGDGRVVSFNPSGDIAHVYMHEDTADVSNVKVTAVYNGKQDETIVDASVKDIRSRLRRQLAGTVTIPDGYTFIPVAGVDNDALEELQFELDVESAGDIELFTNQAYTNKESVSI